MNGSGGSRKGDFIPALGFGWATRFYDPLVRRTTREYAFKRKLISESGIAGDEPVLDLACGTATLSVGLKRRFPELRVRAVDADPEILGMARTKALERGLEIEFGRAFSDELPFADGSFEHVFSTLSFHHLTPRQKKDTIREVRRVLRPGGKFHLADFGRPADPLQNLLGRIVPLIDGRETTRDNLRGRLELLLEENGFAKVERTGAFRTVIGTIRLFRAVR